MKLRKLCSWILVVMIAVTNVFSNAYAASGGSTESAAVSKASSITVDGDLTEGAWANMHTLAKQIVGSTADINAKFAVTWDNDNFYIGVNVEGAVAGKTDFSNDSISYYFSPNNYRGTPYSANDFQVQISNNGNYVAAGAAGVGKNDTLKVSDIKVKYKAQSNGYTMEIAMPWTVTGTIPHADSNVMGFDIMAFSSGENCVMEWSGGNWIDTTQNGTLTFTCDGSEDYSTITAVQPVFAVNEPIYLDYERVYKEDSIAIFQKNDQNSYSVTDAVYQKTTQDCEHPNGEITFTEAIVKGDYVAAVIRGSSNTIAATTPFKVGTIEVMTDKRKYTIGEDSDITVKYCHTTTSKDWIGIYQKDITPSGSDPSILWKYAEVSDDYKDLTFTAAIDSLAEGEYKVVVLENDGYTVKAEYPFTVTQAQSPEIYLNSNTFDIDYTITAYYKNAKTSKDWIGIYKKGTTPASGNPCYAYKYVNSLSTGSVSFTPADVANYQFAPEKALSAGEYELILMHNDGYDILGSVTFTVTDINTLIAPAAVNYVRTSNKAGYADGTVTISKPANTTDIRNYVIYWGDDNGKLPDYDAITTLDQSTLTYTMVKNTFIPAAATKLLAYSSNIVKESKSAASFNIPAQWRIDTSGLTSKFEVLSDIHVTAYDSGVNTRFGNALKDIAATASDSAAIFTNGDNVDIGHKDNYNMFLSILNPYKDKLPKINFVIGNHEYFGSYTDMHHNAEMTCKEKADLFLQTLGAPGLYYDKYINGIHFIALGSEEATVGDAASGAYISDDAYISDTQFAWFESKLAESKDQKTPIFVFLHQSLSDTVAGSIGGKNGQGWNGLTQEQDTRLRSILFKYPQAIMFNGHSHWMMESAHEMYDGGANAPSIFNTAAVGMLWTDVPVQTNVEGSQGFYVETYQDKVLVRGRDFENGKWIPSAAFIVDMNEKYATTDPQISVNKVEVSNITAQAATFSAAYVCNDTQAVKGFQYKKTSDVIWTEVPATISVDKLIVNVSNLASDTSYIVKAFIRTAANEIVTEETTFTTQKSSPNNIDDSNDTSGSNNSGSPDTSGDVKKDTPPTTNAGIIEKALQTGSTPKLKVNKDYQAQIPAEVFNALTTAKKDLVIQSGKIGVTINPDALENILNQNKNNTNLEVTTPPMDSATLEHIRQQFNKDENITLLGDRELTVSLSVKTEDKDNNEITTFLEPIEISMDLSNVEFKDSSKLTIVRYEKQEDGSIKAVKVGGTYDETTKTFRAKVDKPGDYGIVEAKDLVQLILTIGSNINSINGKSVENDVAPEIINDRTMLPVRFIAEKLGAEVIWNAEKEQAEITLDGKTIIVGKAEGMVIKEKEQRALVPVRFVSESLGANVLWITSTQQVQIVR